MKVLRILGVFILAMVTAPGSGGRSHNRGLVLQLAGSHNSIYPDSAVWKVGEPVRVIVTIINESKHVVHFSLTNPCWDWEIDVRDSKGNPAGETDLLRKMKENMKNGSIIVSRNILVSLQPGQKTQDVIEVQMFYDLDRPGQYSIRIQRGFPEVGRKPIKSNRLVLTITP